MAEGQKIEIKQAKGRPMLTWVGKQPLRYVTAFPAQHIESFSAGDMEPDPELWHEWPDSYPKGGLLFHGDKKRFHRSTSCLNSSPGTKESPLASPVQ